MRMAVFLNILNRWESAELNQEEAAEAFGVSERTFRRWTRRYEEEGEAGLLDRKQKKRTFNVLPKPDNLIRYPQYLSHILSSRAVTQVTPRSTIAGTIRIILYRADSLLIVRRLRGVRETRRSFRDAILERLPLDFPSFYGIFSTNATASAIYRTYLKKCASTGSGQFLVINSCSSPESRKTFSATPF